MLSFVNSFCQMDKTLDTFVCIIVISDRFGSVIPCLVVSGLFYFEGQMTLSLPTLVLNIK